MDFKDQHFLPLLHFLFCCWVQGKALTANSGWITGEARIRCGELITEHTYRRRGGGKKEDGQYVCILIYFESVLMAERRVFLVESDEWRCQSDGSVTDEIRSSLALLFRSLCLDPSPPDSLK